MSTLTQWNSAADWYDQNMGEEGDLLNKDIIRPVALEMLGTLTNKKLLDIGCGSGYLTAELAKDAQQVIGTDFAPDFVKLCAEKYLDIKNLSFVQQDVMEALQFETESFDLVLSKMVLQYVPELSMFAKEAARVLRPGGSLVFAVDHPFHTQFFYAQELAGKKNPKYEGLENYFSHTPKTKLSLWGKVELTWYPRMVSDYVQPFVDESLKLTEMRELSEEKDGLILPRVLALKFGK
jgi:ubiquinone/menaquinone biosynthesis C-methylase UbiE